MTVDELFEVNELVVTSLEFIDDDVFIDDELDDGS